MILNKEKRKQRIAYLVLGFFTIAFASVAYFQILCVPRPQQGLILCGGLAALWIRDQQIVNHGIVPYANYPFEYPFMAGALMLLINILARGVLLFAIFLASFIPSLFAVGCLVMLYLLGVDSKKTAAFVVFQPVMLQYGLSFEYEQMFFFLFALYLFTCKRNQGLASGVLMGLASGTKFMPLVTLPFFLQEIRGFARKAKFALIWLGVLGAGILVEYELSPTNFLRAWSYLSGYGIETSWLGIAFGHIIAPTSGNFWDIGNSTVIHGPQVYEIVGLATMCTAVFLISRTKWDLKEKCLWGMSALYLLFWIGGTQNLMDVMLLVPLVEKVRLKWFVLAPYIATGAFGFLTFDVQVFSHAGPMLGYYINVITQGFYFLFILMVITDGLIEQKKKKKETLVQNQTGKAEELLRSPSLPSA